MIGKTVRRLTAIAAVVLVGVAFAPPAGLLDGTIGGDSSVYQEYGDQIADGHIPYRDFFMEYPPGAIPAFVAPTVTGDENYLELLKFSMLACALGVLALAAVSLQLLGAERRRTVQALAVIALAPLLLGPVLTTHYDPWPALLTAVGLAALLASRRTIALGALGVATAAKVYPVVFAPLALLYIDRRWGRRAAWGALAAFAVGCLAVVLPFVVLGPGGIRFTLSHESRRPLQIESLGSALLLAADHLGLYHAHKVQSYESVNLGGSLPSAIGALTVAIELAAVLGIWLLYARGHRDREALVTASAAAVVATVALGKVLSPQYMVWLLPFVPVVAGAVGTRSIALLAAAFGLTQSLRFWDEVGVNGAAWVVLGRDAVLLGLLALLVKPLFAASDRHVAAARDDQIDPP